MTTSAAYLMFAKRYRELADEADTLDDQKLFRKIADTWNWVAEEDKPPGSEILQFGRTKQNRAE